MGYNILHPVEGFSRAPYPFYQWLLRPLRSWSYPVSSGQYNFLFFLSTWRSVTDLSNKEREKQTALSHFLNRFPRRLSENIISA